MYLDPSWDDQALQEHVRLNAVRERGGRMKKTYPMSLFKDDSKYFAILDDAVMQKKELTEQMIKFLHHRTLDKSEVEAAGIYRAIDVLVGNHRVIPHQEVPNAMVEFCFWFNTTQENNDMDAATFAADAHNRFVWIHPFEDANGRTRRVIMNMVLKRSGWGLVVLDEAFRQLYNDKVTNNNIAQFVQEIARLGNNQNVPGSSNMALA